MTAPGTADSKYHVLLIGVDDYAESPLGGCVNDIDAVQQLLLGPRMAKARDRIRIRRLASPIRSPSRKAAGSEQPATLANIRTALDELEQVSSGDRVFIYYSGHGARVEVKARTGGWLHREALVPADYDADPAAPRVLFDFELNDRLARIVKQTNAVTLVLDCCHAAGVTRDDGGRDQRARYLDLTRLLRRAGSLADPANGRRTADPDDRLGAGVEDCHVVSACMNHELAKEENREGGRHGVLTQAFLETLAETLAAAPEVDLSTVTWSRIWQGIQARVSSRNPWQHPWMSGNLGRAVFAGPPVDRDPGIPLARSGGGYRVEAGTLAGITKGALLAVYDEKTKRFPRLGTAADHDQRIAVLQVTSADRAWALAAPAGGGTPGELRAGARGRLVKAGVGARLRCGVIPPNPQLENQLAASPLLELVRPGEDAPVRLEHIGGVWRLTDDKHGSGRAAPVLFALETGELRYARAVVEHYRAYSLPLRIADGAGDLPGQLELSVLSCPRPAPGEQKARPRSAPSKGKDTYQLQSGDGVCFSARNRSPYPLRVTLLNCAASGKVQLLGDQEIDAGNVYVFWAGNQLEAPFRMEPPPGSQRCIDRLVAIGRTAMGHDLGYLRVDTTFADLVPRTRGEPTNKDIAGGANHNAPVIEQWTSAQVVIETRRT